MLEGLVAGWGPLTALTLGLLLVHCNGSDSNFKCGIGLDSPGATLPKGDIVLEYGSSLEIFCNLDLSHRDAQGYNASNLVFYKDMDPVPSELIQIVNSTTIRLFEQSPAASKAYYYCKLRTPSTDIGVCLNTVAVGYRPQEVLNFTCLSHNWSNLTCRWTKPENYIKTKYTLHFHLPGRAGARMTFRCPPLKEDHVLKRTLQKNEDVCFWDHSTSPPYRQPYEFYYFLMSGENQLDAVNFNPIKFHHYSHVIPSPADKLTVIATSTSSIELKWEVPFPMGNFPPGVVHRVEYQASWDDRTTWHIANTSELGMHNSSYVYNLTGLRYASTIYDIRVYMRSAVAVGEDKWSLPASLTVRTDSTIPGAAPLTDVGSFEVTRGITRDVYVYWQYIPDYLHNGEEFEYKIFVKENNYDRPDIVPSEITKAYAKFRAISHNSYTFTIVAANVHGYSKDKAIVYVPSRKEIPPEPISFTKIAFGTRLYELSWKPPSGHGDLIENYTIFWCDNPRDRPYQCTGFLNWTHVPNDVFVKNITVAEEKIYQFAISANSKYASSGMVWASCTVLHNKDPGTMKSVWINRIGSTFIEVGWKLECSDRIGIISGFQIHFCPIAAPNNITCKEPQQTTNLEVVPGQIHGNVTGLRPYTTYVLSLSIMTNNKEVKSDVLLNTTLEAAPDPPRNVTVSSVTNTSMIVEWLPPASLNGIIRFYRVHYNDSVRQVENTSVNNMRMKVKLENLTSYMTYKVGVEACTTECSKSANVYVLTEIGSPGKMERPHVRFINSSLVLVSWKPPLIQGGILNYYQVVIQQSDELQNTSTFYYTSVGNESQIPIPDCKTEVPERKYTFMVRAVNIDHQNRTYHGVWSDPGEINCYNSGPSPSVMAAIWVFGFIIISALCLVFAYAGKRVWMRCKEMQDLEVKLPPGLDPASGKEKDQDFSLDVSWPADIHDHHLSGTGSSSADEELLLQKKEERHGRNPSGASSGCSSGHESVSSSLTSGTHISSDSGTEVDQRPSSPGGVFEDPSPWERVSLRQRNVSVLRQVGDQYVKMTKGADSVARSTPNLTDLDGLSTGGSGGTYSCLGAWPSTGYISMPSSEEVGVRSGGEGLYCKVGLEPLPAQRTLSSSQEQTQVLPVKGYVMLSSSTDSPPSGSNSLVQQPMSVTQLQPHGYVSHNLPWSSPLGSPKQSPSGKSYVMAGELDDALSKKSIASPPLLIEVEDSGDDILDLEPVGEARTPDSYSRFALRPLNVGERTTNAERMVSKPGSDFINPSSGGTSPPETVDLDAAGMGSPGHRTTGATGGYVPHRHFEKRDNEPFGSPVFSDHRDESYSLVSVSSSDTNVKSPTE
ncbi:cytokine receptor [Anabrus simplex]|uniref:cytokine receptor n=1 Tax=Anabrus simplex TaxID=316456 RepID=UPI0034DD0B24